MQTEEQLKPRKPRLFRPSGKYPVEIFVSVLRETMSPQQALDTSDSVVAYWRNNIENSPNFQQGKEQLYVLMLNTRRRIIAHELVTMGLVDQVMVHSREVFRSAIVANAQSIIMVHNHPSGDTTPSESDISATRMINSSARILKIDCLDHIIVASPVLPGTRGHTSLRELGYFCP